MNYNIQPFPLHTINVKEWIVLAAIWRQQDLPANKKSAPSYQQPIEEHFEGPIFRAK